MFREDICDILGTDVSEQSQRKMMDYFLTLTPEDWISGIHQLSEEFTGEKRQYLIHNLSCLPDIEGSEEFFLGMKVYVDTVVSKAQKEQRIDENINERENIRQFFKFI